MELAYLAGLLDGEGSIMLSGQGPGRPRTPELSIGMVDQHIIEAVRRSYGGFTKNVVRPPRQTMYYWRCKGFAVVELLERMRPLLVIQRRGVLADLVTSDPVIKSRAKGPGNSKVRHNEMIFQKMREANALRLSAPPEMNPRNPSDADIAYLAGILDGEGYIGPRGVLEVHSTDPELPAWCQSRFGGQVYLGREAEGNQRRLWRWHRAPTGFKWAASVADHMMIERKREAVAAIQGFKRTPPPAPSLEATPQDEAFLGLLDRGWLIKPAIQESGIPPARGRRLSR